MSIVDRFSNIFKGSVSLRLRKMEEKNPEAVYASAIESGEERLVDARGRLAGLIALRNKLEDQARTADAQVDKLLETAQAALSEGEDDTALVLQHQAQTLIAKRDDALAQVVSVGSQVEEGKSALTAMGGELESLKREKETMLAKQKLAAARIVAHDTASGMSEDADVIGLSKVRESIDGLDMRAHKGMTDREGNPIHAKVEAIAQKSAEERAREELARLKARLRPASVEPAPDDKPNEDEPGGGKTL